MQGGKLRFSRSFRLGGDHLSEQWTTQFISEVRRSIAATTHSEAEVNTGGPRGLTLPETETELWLCGSGHVSPISYLFAKRNSTFQHSCGIRFMRFNRMQVLTFVLCARV